MMKHFMMAEDLCGHMWQSFFNHTNPFTFFAVNDYNNKHIVGEAGDKQFFYNQQLQQYIYTAHDNMFGSMEADTQH